MALNDDDEYGVVPMEISTDEDTEESKKLRKNNKKTQVDSKQLKLPFEQTQNQLPHQEPQIHQRRFVRAQRQSKNNVNFNNNKVDNNGKWKCVCCKTLNENNIFDCCNCMIPRPRVF